MKTLLAALFLLACSTVMAQPEKKSVVIGSMTTKPSALLVVNPEHSDQGVLMPQLSTTQRLNLKPATTGEDGLIVFDLDLGAYFYWSKGAWVRLLNDATRRIAFQSIDPANFSELKSGGDSRHAHIAVFKSDHSFITVTREGTGEIVAPVELPHGASIRELTFYYSDNEDDNLQVELVRQAFTGDLDTLISWQSSGSSSAVLSQTLSDFNDMEVIDRENYTYRLVVAFDNDDEVRNAQDARQRFYGAKIKYEE